MKFLSLENLCVCLSQNRWVIVRTTDLVKYLPNVMVYYLASKTHCAHSAYRHPTHYSTCDLNRVYCGQCTAATSGVLKDSELPSGHACRIMFWITFPFKPHMKGKQITEWDQAEKDIFFFFHFWHYTLNVLEVSQASAKWHLYVLFGFLL